MIMVKELTIKCLLVSLVSICLCQQNFAQNLKSELKLNNTIDSLSFMLGVAQSNGLKEYLSEKMDVDTAYMSDFANGLRDGALNCNEPNKNAYYAGVQIGQQLCSQMIKGINLEIFGENEEKSISLSHLLSGFLVGINNSSNEALFSEASELTQILMEKIKEDNITPEQHEYKKKNEDWLEANKKKPGVITTTSGLQYKVIKKGLGKKPTEDSEIVCHYEGRLIDGTEFDNSYKRNEPVSFPINTVIKGWTEALLLMPVGSIWEIYIPQTLGYGNRETGMIKPFSTLVFKIELISAKDILE